MFNMLLVKTEFLKILINSFKNNPIYIYINSIFCEKKKLYSNKQKVLFRKIALFTVLQIILMFDVRRDNWVPISALAFPICCGITGHAASLRLHFTRIKE